MPCGPYCRYNTPPIGELREEIALTAPAVAEGVVPSEVLTGQLMRLVEASQQVAELLLQWDRETAVVFESVGSGPIEL